MAPAHRGGEAIDENVVLAQHLHVRVLDELIGRPSREQRRTFDLPGVTNGVSSGNCLEVATFCVGEKSSAHEITRVRLWNAQVAE